MTTKTYEVALRLSVKDRNALIDTLKASGREGEKFAKQLERSLKPVNPMLKAIDAGAKEINAELTVLANRAGPGGAALQALGKGGLVAAAGFAAAGVAIRTSLRIAREAITEFNQIGRQASSLRIDTDSYQAGRQAFRERGADAAQFDQALRAMTERSTQAARGQGELYSRLRQTNPELMRQLALAQDNGERLRILTDYFRDMPPEIERNNVALAVFGDVGLQVADVLERQEGGFAATIARAKEMGVVVRADLIESAGRLNARLEESSTKLDVSLKSAFITLGPVMASFQEDLAALVTGLSEFLDRFLDVSFATDEELQRRIEKSESFGERLRRTFNWVRLGRVGVAADDTPQAAREELTARQFQRWFAANPRKNEGAGAGGGAIDLIDPEAERAAAERARLEAEAARIRADLGDITAELAAKERGLQVLVNAGLLTQDQANRTLAAYRAELDGSAAAAERWRGVIEGAQTPVQRLHAMIAALRTDHEAGRLSAELYAQTLENLNRLLDEAEKKEFDDSEAGKAVAEVREAIVAAREKELTLEQRIAAERRRVAALPGLSQAEQAEYMQGYIKRLAEAEAGTRQLTAAQIEMMNALSGNIRTIEDVAFAFGRMLGDMLIRWQMTRQQMAAQGLTGPGFLSFAGSAVGALFGAGGGPAGDPVLAQQIAMGAKVAAAVHHTGGRIGRGQDIRMVPASVFANAARAHRGAHLRPGERPIIAEDGERMFSRDDNATLMRKIDAALGSGPQIIDAAPRIVLNNYAGAEVEQRQEIGADGRPQTTVDIKRALSQHAESGGFDKAMRDRYGIIPGVGVPR